MLTLKEQLINDLSLQEAGFKLKTFETLDTGEYNEMTWVAPKEKILSIISEHFDNDLKGSVPNGFTTKISGWEIIK